MKAAWAILGAVKPSKAPVVVKMRGEKRVTVRRNILDPVIVKVFLSAFVDVAKPKERCSRVLCRGVLSVVIGKSGVEPI